MTDKEKDKERNYVAEAQNWEARVRGELDSARVSSVRAIVHVGRTCHVYSVLSSTNSF